MDDPRRPRDAENEPDTMEEEGRVEEPVLEDLEEEGAVDEEEGVEGDEDLEDEDESAPDQERKTA
jgi:hypothetical protein